MELASKNIVITGAASGIGRGLAERFAAEGPKGLVLADLDLEAVRAVAEPIGASAVQTDVGREADIVALVARARERHGPIDLFCSNAGIGGPPGGPEAPDVEWQRTWEINVMAHIWAARAVLPEMVERGEGYLLSTASAAGPLTQGDLAAMIGCTRQSVNKLLGMFSEEGLIRLDRDRIVILDLEGLARSARR